MKAPTLVLAAFVAALCSSELLPSTQAVTPAFIKKNCVQTKTCYKGGVKANSCKIEAQACPPCVTFDNSGCFELTNGVCSFGYDCTTYWDGATDINSGSGSGKPDSGPAAGGATAGTNATAKPSTSTRSSSSSSGSTGGVAGTAGSGVADDGGNDMSAIFAIIGATMGVIAVAVIFLTLVRRSRAAHNDDEEEAATPPAMSKDPQSATAAVTYTSYAGAGTGAATHARGASNGADTTDAALYYNQKPQNLPMASPRVAGRAVPAAAVPRAQPMANPAPAARAMPVFANKAPLGAAPTSQTQQQQAIPEPVQLYYQVSAQPVVLQEAAAPRRVSSPRNRRESFEF